MVSCPVSHYSSCTFKVYLDAVIRCIKTNIKHINAVVRNKIYSWFFLFEKNHAEEVCISLLFSLVPVLRGLDHVSLACTVHVNRAAELYLCRTGCLSLLACFLNLSASHSLIYTHSHLGADHSEHQFSTVGG